MSYFRYFAFMVSSVLLGFLSSSDRTEAIPPLLKRKRVLVTSSFILRLVELLSTDSYGTAFSLCFGLVAPLIQVVVFKEVTRCIQDTHSAIASSLHQFLALGSVAHSGISPPR